MLFKSTAVKILVVDDDPSMLRQVQFRLERRDHFDVITVENGEDGLKQATSNHFNLIILDWMLPDMQGIDVLDELKSNKATWDIPVLMMTGLNKIGEVEEAFDRGADGYLTKPFELAKLSEKVKEMLDSKGK